MDLLPVGQRTTSARPAVITVFKPNVTRDEAIELLKRAGIRRWTWSRRMNPLRSVAELYVPFQLFRAHIKHGRTAEQRIMAIDLLCGLFDPFTFPAVPGRTELIELRSRNAPAPMISIAHAEKSLRTKLQRLLFQYGFFRVGNLDVQIEPLQPLYMPYWIGFYGAGERASVEAIDATRRVREGAKFRRILQDWLQQGPRY